jgi:hypothetical protein
MVELQLRLALSTGATISSLIEHPRGQNLPKTIDGIKDKNASWLQPFFRCSGRLHLTRRPFCQRPVRADSVSELSGSTMNPGRMQKSAKAGGPYEEVAGVAGNVDAQPAPINPYADGSASNLNCAAQIQAHASACG